MQKDNDSIVGMLCLVCGNPAFIDLEDENFDKSVFEVCPVCGDSSVPAAFLNDSLTLTITAYELRILTMWADAHTRMINLVGKDIDNKARKVFTTIIDRLSMQTDVSLTRSQDIAKIRARMEENGLSSSGLVFVGAGGVCQDCNKPVDLFNYQSHVCNPENLDGKSDVSASD